MGCQALSDSQTFIFLVALITHESLPGLGESEGTFDDSATAKMMREKDEKGIIGEPVSQSFETPRKTHVAQASSHQKSNSRTTHGQKKKRPKKF